MHKKKGPIGLITKLLKPTQSLGLTIFLFSNNAFAEGAQILNYFPSCEADIVESVKIEKRLTRRLGQNDKDIQLEKAIAELIKQANDIGVEAIIITGNKTKTPSRHKSALASYRRFTVEISADFLKLCEDDKSLSKNPTEYNDEGLPQAILSSGFSITQTILLDQYAEELFKPTLESNIVSSSGELYGVGLTSSSEHAIDLLGTPSLVFTLNDTSKVLAYGRSHWLYFVDDKLVKASTAKTTIKPFTYELINQIPFEARFDDLAWSINEVIKKGDKLEDGSKKEIEPNPDVSIKLNWSGYINKAQELVSFELSNNVSNDLNYSISEDNTSVAYDWISEALNKPLDPKDLIQKSKGEIVVDKRTKRYIYDNRLFFDVKSKRIRRITIGDSLYKTVNDSTSEPWHFGDYYQGQTLDDAIMKTSQPFSEINEEIHINYEDYTIILYAYDDEIYKIEVDLYQST